MGLARKRSSNMSTYRDLTKGKEEQRSKSPDSQPIKTEVQRVGETGYLASGWKLDRYERIGMFRINSNGNLKRVQFSGTSPSKPPCCSIKCHHPNPFLLFVMRWPNALKDDCEGFLGDRL
jgi:hypothetical protein